MRQADAAPRSGRSHNWQRVDIVGNPRHREGTDRNVEGGRAEDLGHLCRRLRTSTPEAASATGLLIGTPVLVAGHDHQVAAWAAGVRNVGDVANSVGTAEALLTVVGEVPQRTPLLHEGMSVVRTIDGDTEAIVAGTPSSGAFLTWMADRYADGSVSALLGELTETFALPSPGFWLPYPRGRQSPHPDPDATAVHFGADGIPAIEALEALTLQVAWLLRRHHELTTMDVDDRLIIIGEIVRQTPLWGHLKATLSPGASLATTEQPVATGAALLALVRSEHIAASTTLPTEMLQPLPGLEQAYAERLDAFISAAIGAETPSSNLD